MDAVEAATTRGEAYDLEYPINGYRDGKLRWVRATGKVFMDEEGRPGNFSGTLIDITARKLDEQRKNDFIGIVSHELRSPLTSMNGYVQMLTLKAAKNRLKLLRTSLPKHIAKLSECNHSLADF